MPPVAWPGDGLPPPVARPPESPPSSFPTTVTSNEQRLARTTPELILKFLSAFYAYMESSRSYNRLFLAGLILFSTLVWIVVDAVYRVAIKLPKRERETYS